MMAWQPLYLSESAGAQLPPLLISANLDSDSYTIHLTDLTHIWSESLSRRAIIHKSQEEGTSIDPSDDDQLQIFLEKIRLGLKGSKDTTSTLTINTDDDRPALILNLRVKLPGGLAPLQWPIHLSAAPDAVLTRQLVVPLVEAQHIRLQETLRLAEALREKDHVIQKLLDKLESQGTELGELFPQAAGKPGRKIDRKKAEDRVRGLAQFDLGAWRREVDVEKSRNVATLISHVFQSNEYQSIKAGEGPDKVEQSWWKDQKGITVDLKSGKITTNFGKSSSRNKKTNEVQAHVEPGIVQNFTGKSANRISAAKGDSSNSDEDGDFQVQSTPPHLKSKTEPVISSVDPTSDSNSDDINDSSQASKIPDSFPVSQPAREASQPTSPPKKGKRVGILGGKKAAKAAAVNEESAEDNILPPVKQSKKLGSIGGGKGASKPPYPEKADDSSTEDDTDVPHSKHTRKLDQENHLDILSSSRPKPELKEFSISSKPKKGPAQITTITKKKDTKSDNDLTPPSYSVPAATKKGKLGQIGGKKKKAEKEPTSTPEEYVLLEKATPKKKNIGAIGRRKRVSSPSVPPAIKADEDEDVVTRGRKKAIKEEKEQSPEIRERSEERADKKRLALKRELEAKTKVAPVKKKRKF